MNLPLLFGAVVALGAVVLAPKRDRARLSSRSTAADRDREAAAVADQLPEPGPDRDLVHQVPPVTLNSIAPELDPAATLQLVVTSDIETVPPAPASEEMAAP